MAKKKIDLGASNLFKAPEKNSEIQIVPNEESPLYEEAIRDIEFEKNDPRIKRKGRPKNEDLVRGVSSQFGLTKDFRRASYIMPIELIEFVENYAYTERIRIQDAISKLVTIGKNQVEKEYRKEGKEILRKDKKK